MPSKNFKVIIAGGGPVGLTAAHALTRANIDFVLLEQRSSIMEMGGASLVLLPTGLRVLGQLGLWDGLMKICTELSRVTRSDHSGNDIGNFNFFEYIKLNHGAYPAVVSRSDLTKLLYDSFPPEIHENMFPNKKVSGITNTNDGVTISCADGTSYTGSILIGADGAHSQVRKQMRLLAQHESPSLGVALDAEQPFLTTYRALWFRFPTSLGLNPGEAHESHGNGLGCQVFAGNDTAIAGVYEKLDKPTRERSRYTRADQDAIVNKWGDVQIAKNLSLKKAFESKTHADLVDLEEGVVEHWSHGRIVLAGDAAHKYTPSTGSGCNTGIVDVVVLANELSKIYNKDNATPTLDSITTAYRNYQDARQEIVAAGCKASAGATATSTWSSMGLKLFDKYILPNNTLQKILADMGASRFADSPVFDYINGAEPMIGKVPWTQPIKPDSRVAV